VGETITYTLAVDNTGNVTLSNVTVTDPLPGLSAIDCGGGSNVIASLAPDDPVVNCTATYAITQADLDAGSVDNTATAAGSPPTGADVSDSADATITAEQNPALTLEKSASPAVYAAVGDVITYTYLVTNSGNLTLDEPVTVSDDKAAATCTPSGDGVLDPGETVTCTATYTITQADLDAGSVTNTASATADGVTSNEDSATVRAQPVGAAPIPTLGHLALLLLGMLMTGIGVLRYRRT
jgi:uncharacterized repeat protein (TIGR01451 family)